LKEQSRLQRSGADEDEAENLVLRDEMPLKGANEAELATFLQRLVGSRNNNEEGARREGGSNDDKEPRRDGESRRFKPGTSKKS
jgi:hypothetical protein